MRPYRAEGRRCVRRSGGGCSRIRKNTARRRRGKNNLSELDGGLGQQLYCYPNVEVRQYNCRTNCRTNWKSGSNLSLARRRKSV